MCHVPSQVHAPGVGGVSGQAEVYLLLPSSLRRESGSPDATCFTETKRCASAPSGHVYRPGTYAAIGVLGSILTTPIWTALAPPLWLLVGSANATDAATIATNAATSDAARNRVMLIHLPLLSLPLGRAASHTF